MDCFWQVLTIVTDFSFSLDANWYVNAAAIYSIFYHQQPQPIAAALSIYRYRVVQKATK